MVVNDYDIYTYTWSFQNGAQMLPGNRAGPRP